MLILKTSTNAILSRHMTSFNSADRKIKRMLRNSQEYKIRLDKESSQSERKLVLRPELLIALRANETDSDNS